VTGNQGDSHCHCPCRSRERRIAAEVLTRATYNDEKWAHKYEAHYIVNELVRANVHKCVQEFCSANTRASYEVDAHFTIV
jgi:hypothetical protein